MTDKVTRREFVGGSMAVAVGGSLLGGMPLAAQEGPLPAVITTWEFGPKANATAWKILSEGGSSIDAVEKGINEIELDPENNHFSVGYGGLPNEDGEVTLDAVIMYGPKHAAGAVACLKRIKAPISVARKVMEKTQIGRASCRERVS
jgi:N4-(beta-N-acetylglucosaminyl)-L-asparaginase